MTSTLKRLLIVVIDVLIIFGAFYYDNFFAWFLRILIVFIIAQWGFNALKTLAQKSKKAPSSPTGHQSTRSDTASGKTSSATRPKKDQLTHYLALLELRPDFTATELKQSYQAKIREYHPDKLPPTVGKKLVQYAERMTKEINIAHDYLSARVKKDPFWHEE